MKDKNLSGFLVYKYSQVNVTLLVEQHDNFMN